MVIDSGSIYVFIRQDNVTWEEVHKVTPAYGEADDWFGYSVAVSGDTTVIVSSGGNEWVSNSGSGDVYIMIDGKCIENGKIVPEDGGFNDLFGVSVAILGSTYLSETPYK